MNRCPQCNRLENDDSLVFCRTDRTVLVSDSGPITGDVGRAKFASSPMSSELETSILPHRTDADMNRPTAPTTVLPVVQTPSSTRALSKPKGLEKDFQARAGTLIFIAHYVQYEPLRDDPRSLDLLRRIGLRSNAYC